MDLDHESEARSIDAKLAEQALQLAVRLQHEAGERISYEVLDKTADEAGIDRAYLRQALRRLQEQRQEERFGAEMYRARQGRVFAGMMAALVAALDAILARSPDWNSSSAHVALVFAVAAAMAAATIAAKTRAFSSRVRRTKEGGLERQG